VDCEFEASLGYIVRPCLKTSKQILGTILAGGLFSIAGTLATQARLSEVFSFARQSLSNRTGGSLGVRARV
jgi:hypothetical protein